MSDSCKGIRQTSFSMHSASKTPSARLNTRMKPCRNSRLFFSGVLKSTGRLLERTNHPGMHKWLIDNVSLKQHSRLTMTVFVPALTRCSLICVSSLQVTAMEVHAGSVSVFSAVFRILACPSVFLE